MLCCFCHVEASNFTLNWLLYFYFLYFLWIILQQSELRPPKFCFQENIFEWQFAIRGPQDSEFEGGIYHGRIQLPAEYPFKPPSFVLLTVMLHFSSSSLFEFLKFQQGCVVKDYSLLLLRVTMKFELILTEIC